MKHIMIDIETYGLNPASVILSVGAVRFDTEADIIDENTFYMNLDPIEQQRRYGMQVDLHAVEWWMQKGSAAQEALTNPARVPLEHFLAEFHAWIGTDDQQVVWAKGSLDFNCLTTAYHVGGYEALPWRYDSVRDFRTMMKVFDHLVPEDSFVEPIIKHHALGDAIAQARHLQKIYAALQPKVHIQ